jgi:hypothetical protein
MLRTAFAPDAKPRRAAPIAIGLLRCGGVWYLCRD